MEISSLNKRSLGLLVVWSLTIAIGLIATFIIFKPPAEKLNVETVADQGRDHVPAGTAVEYNSNPPTSGPHYANWEKPGIYDQVLEDGKLIHSLEHGYVIISYNCAKETMSKKQETMMRQVYAHETEEVHEEIPASDSAEVKTGDITGWKDDSNCQNLIEQIKQVTKKTGMGRLIVAPRPNMDTPLALTAWTKLMKLDRINETKMLAFIAKYRNKGPEKTME